MQRIRSFLILVLILISSQSFSQIKDNDPSTWPVPTAELIKNKFYSKQKLKLYYKWKQENLPDLYILFEQERISPQYTEYNWDEGTNYVFRYDSSVLSEGQYVEFRVLDRPQEAKIKKLSIDSLNKIDLKNAKWISEQLEESEFSESCFVINNLGRAIYLVLKDNSNNTALIMKTDQCFSDTQYNDEAQNFRIKRQGDSLIQITSDELH